MTQVHEAETGQGGKFFTLFVDDKEYHVHEEYITGGAILDLAGIPRDQGLIIVHEDGTQESVDANDVIELKPGRRFKKAPRFKRG